MNKREMMKEWLKIFDCPKVVAWYDKNLTGDAQANTIKSLIKGVEEKKLTIEEALITALIVGVQWNVKFEGVP